MQSLNPSLKAANPSESSYYKGGYCYRILTAPLKYLARTWGTISVWINSPNSLEVNSPLPIRIWCGVKNLFSQDFSSNFIRSIPTLSYQRYDITNSEIVRLFLHQPRSNGNKGLLKPKAEISLFLFLKQCFPSSNLSYNDYIYLCDHANNIQFHTALKKYFHHTIVRENLQVFTRLSSQLLKDSISYNSNSINVKRIIDDYKAGLLEHFFLCDRSDVRRLFATLNSSEKHLKKIHEETESEDDIFEIRDYQREINILTTRILKKNPSLFQGIFSDEIEDENLIARKKVLFVSVLISVISHAAMALNLCVYELARNPQLQTELKEKAKEFVANRGTNNYINYFSELEIFFTEVIKKHPVVPVIIRQVNRDLILTYKSPKNNHKETKAFFAGDILFLRTDLLTKSVSSLNQEQESFKHSKLLSFGDGPHQCPGRFFSDVSTKEFLVQLLINHDNFDLINPEKLVFDGCLIKTPNEDLHVSIPYANANE